MLSRKVLLFTFALIVAFPSSAFAVTAPYLDANGWTVFTPSTDTRTIYVSNSLGIDTNDGLSESTPKKTIAAGKALLRNGYPDWLLLKKGDTWKDENFGGVNISGRSAAEPMLVSSYGSGARPLIKTAPAASGISTGSGGNYFAVIGLEFYSYTRDPGSPDYIVPTSGPAGFTFLTPSNWLLLEDNKFSFYSVNVIQAWPSGTFQNSSLRRNVIANNYNNTGAHSQGLYTFETNNLLLEENIFDHNGWNANVTGARSTIFNRNMYLSHGHGTITARGNIDANGASGGMQLRVGGIAENNLYLNDPISVVFGSNENPVEDVSGVIRNNVTIDSRNIDTQNQGSAIWISSYNTAKDGTGTNGPSRVTNLEVYGNIIAHQTQGTGNIAAIRMEGDGPYTNTAVHDNIVYDWSRLSWPSTTDHRAYGFSISVATTSTGTSFYNNTIQQTISGFLGTTKNCDSNSAGISRYNNTYWDAEIDPPTIWSKGWFDLNGCGSAQSYDNWMTKTGETGATKQLVSYPDPNRTTATYMSSLGMTASYDAFMQKADAQSKDTWDSRFTAATVNDYIRTGFGVAALTAPVVTPPPAPVITAPSVTTDSSSGVTATTATLGGSITATGGATPTTRGIVYGLTASYGSTAVDSGSFSTGAFTKSVTGLVCNTTYHYAAFATNSSGTTNGSDHTFTTGVCPDTTAPTVPTGITFSSINSSAVTLSWNASTDTVGVTSYRVYRNASFVGTATTPSYIDTGLSPSFDYAYTVSALDAAGNTSVLSTSVPVKTSAAAVTPAAISGGGGSSALAVTTSTPIAATTSVIVPVTTAVTVPVATITTPVTTIKPSSLSDAQITAILGLLTSFGAEPSVIANVTASLRGTTTTSSPKIVVPTSSFTKNLQIGMSDPQVALLQKYLNTHGFPIAQTGPGSLNQEVNTFGITTFKALTRFQAAKHLPVTGFFGPMTRGVMNTN